MEIPDLVANASTPSFLRLTLDVGMMSESITITAQGQRREQPPVSSTALQQSRPPAPRTKAFASVTSELPTTAEPVRVGGNIRPAKLLNSPKPEYPVHLIAQGVEGTVILQSIIGTEGQVLNVQPRNSQVDPDLAKAAMDAVRQWRYEPTLLNGKPVEIVTNVTFEFRLKP